MAPIERVTIFKIPTQMDCQPVIDQYKILTSTCTVRDGKPYIMNATVGRVIPDPRNKGYTLAVKMTFASLEDLKYYDDECPAHKEVKLLLRGLVEDLLTVYFENAL